MVNERQGKVYEPTPVYNRKMARQIVRKALERKFCYGANKKLKEAFTKIRQMDVIDSPVDNNNNVEVTE